ncbi:hypothetical protein CRG98_006886 [Punica granatum]|uniref:Uncharacterized protein n=1 Tax=Punica granatum TaxID=22663 RepID=A0A2I0KW93_PUNGR|nr:hypothetical protein CRG98_006886 [Punica granatum]
MYKYTPHRIIPSAQSSHFVSQTPRTQRWGHNKQLSQYSYTANAPNSPKFIKRASEATSIMLMWKTEKMPKVKVQRTLRAKMMKNGRSQRGPGGMVVGDLEVLDRIKFLFHIVLGGLRRRGEKGLRRGGVVE